MFNSLKGWHVEKGFNFCGSAEGTPEKHISFYSKEELNINYHPAKQ